MCFNELDERSLLPDCHIANRVFLFSLLQSLQEQERRPEDVDDELRDRYTVFRQVLPNYPLPELESPEIQSYFEGYQQERHTDLDSSGEDTSDTSLDSDPGQIAIAANRTD